jgi:nitrogen-specific signal transduction histidine kinase
MPLPSDDRPSSAYGPSDQLRHDLKSPLTTIHARAQLLERAVRRSPSLADEERARMLAGLAEIEAVVRELVTRIDAMSDEGGEPGEGAPS